MSAKSGVPLSGTKALPGHSERANRRSAIPLCYDAEEAVDSGRYDLPRPDLCQVRRPRDTRKACRRLGRGGTPEICEVERCRTRYTDVMVTARYVYWQDGDHWLGYFEDFPDYLTQGDSFEDLTECLKDLYQDLTSGAVAGIRRMAELSLSS